MLILRIKEELPEVWPNQPLVIGLSSCNERAGQATKGESLGEYEKADDCGWCLHETICFGKHIVLLQHHEPLGSRRNRLPRCTVSRSQEKSPARIEPGLGIRINSS